MDLFGEWDETLPALSNNYSIIEKYLIFMKRLLVYFLFGLLVFVGCKVQYVPVETIREVHIKDSVYFRDTLVRVELEKARLSDFVNVGDTLVLSTDYVRSTAFLDTLAGTLKGSLVTLKDYVEKPVQFKERIVYRDSIVKQEIPVPVEVEKIVKHTPWYAKVLAWIGFAALLLLCGALVWKFAQ